MRTSFCALSSLLFMQTYETYLILAYVCTTIISGMKKDSIRRELQQTADGSSTLFLPEMNEHYHSVNGAIQESRHIFINAGLRQIEKRDLRIMEIGFGTGLNAFLTLLEAEAVEGRRVDYHSVELYPLDMELIRSLNYAEMVAPEKSDLFMAMHKAAWNEPVELTPRFTLHKIEGDSNTCALPSAVDLIYFDAFAPDKQPEMWNPEIFSKLYAHTAQGGLIVTYCAKGEVRRRMQAAGFSMERLPGPPGKRHMLLGRARRLPIE